MTLHVCATVATLSMTVGRHCARLVGAVSIGVLLIPAAWAADDTSLHESIAPQFTRALSNVPGKSFTSVIVTFPPGARADPHRHGEAFVYAYVLEGSVRSQIDDEPARVYRRGEDWSEPPGARHKITENTSRAKPAKLLVIFVAATGAQLKTPDLP